MALSSTFIIIVAAALALFIALGLMGVFSGTLSSIVPFVKGPALKPGVESVANAQCSLKCAQAGGTLTDTQWVISLDVDGDGDLDEVKCINGAIAAGGGGTTGSSTPLPGYVTGTSSGWSKSCGGTAPSGGVKSRGDSCDPDKTNDCGSTYRCDSVDKICK